MLFCLSRCLEAPWRGAVLYGTWTPCSIDQRSSYQIDYKGVLASNGILPRKIISPHQGPWSIFPGAAEFLVCLVTLWVVFCGREQDKTNLQSQRRVSGKRQWESTSDFNNDVIWPQRQVYNWMINWLPGKAVWREESSNYWTCEKNHTGAPSYIFLW